MKALPPVTLPEICFAGRSNVGKSSLVNVLTGRKTLAGHRKLRPHAAAYFFNLSDRLQLVDLPGLRLCRRPQNRHQGLE